MPHDIEAAKALVQWLLPKLKVPGLEVKGVGFDYLRQSYTVSLTRRDHAATMILAVERIAKLQNEEPFALRHLRKEVESALGLESDAS